MKTLTNARSSIVVASTSLAELFCGKTIVASDGSDVRGRLQIPEYQRPYRWGVAQFQRLTNDLTRFFGGTIHTTCDFYLGSVVLHQQGRQLNIIDGQQRLTSMLLIAHQLGYVRLAGCMSFSAPESQQQIQTNLRWLRQQECPEVDFARINVTLVVTHSEDDAYRFFETMNTGGVRLNGPQIIKAHHLRSVAPEQQDEFARKWEAIGNLDRLVDMVMKVRCWETLRWRPLSSHRNPPKVREEIVLELAELAGSGNVDVAYVLTWFDRAGGQRWPGPTLDRYAMRQPLEAGVNSIHYLLYLHQLRTNLMGNSNLRAFQQAYDRLVVNARGSEYLQNLYDSALLFYASRFGTANLFEASLWLFRSIYSPRLTNEKMVRESTVQSFSFTTPVLDWIAASFNHRQFMTFLQGHNYIVDAHNLDAGTVKGKFVMSVRNWFKLELPADEASIAQVYDAVLQDAIKKAVLSEQQQ